MAQLTSSVRLNIGVKRSKTRFNINLRALATDLAGTVDELDELLRKYGLPNIDNKAELGSLAVMCELAERMGQRVDIHRYVLELR